MTLLPLNLADQCRLTACRINANHCLDIQLSNNGRQGLYLITLVGYSLLTHAQAILTHPGIDNKQTTIAFTGETNPSKFFALQADLLVGQQVQNPLPLLAQRVLQQGRVKQLKD